MEAKLASTGRKRATASSLVCAGGEETRKRVRRAHGRTATGGLYTSRGPTLEEHGLAYKPYNEDAAVLGVIPASRTKARRELIFAGAFDQAGGMGQIPGQTGGASRLVAEAVEAAARDIAKGAVPAVRLREAVATTHGAINALNVANSIEAVTTASFGVVTGGVAYLVNCGDSKTYLFDSAGRLKSETRSHNLCDEAAARTGDVNAGLQFSNIITSSVGGDGVPEVDHYQWDLAPGDVLLFVSDGVADANLEAQRSAALSGKPWDKHSSEVTTEQLSALVAEGGEGWDITARVSQWALGKMAGGDAKADNTTCVALRAY
jgi:serine/threonine protein phosphatase PrpC